MPANPALACPACDGTAVDPRAMRSGGFDLARCAGCGFLWLPVVPPVSYDSYGEYLAAVDLDAEMRSIERHWGPFLRDALARFGPGARLLDIGCGAGFFVHYCRRMGFDAHGFEPSSRLRAQAKSVMGLDLHDALGSLLTGAPFHVIAAFEVIEHVPASALASFLGNIESLLARDGLVVGTTPNPESLNVRLLGDRDPVIWPPSHVSYFTMKAVAALLGRHGFTRIRLFTYGLAPFRARKERPSFVTAPRTPLSRVAAVAVRALLYAAGRGLRGTRLGYTTAFVFTRGSS